jgi:hypothetical protein
MWSEETPDKHCKNGIFYYMDGKLACQQLCEADSGCVGIAWSQSFEIYCYLCHDDILSNACCNYGFYRNPGNGEVHSICLKLFIDFNIIVVFLIAIIIFHKYSMFFLSLLP